jgi:tetratricopeptide (TPR) repeat protein
MQGRMGAGPTGMLLFENSTGNGDELIPAETLCGLLREYKIPVMVLNACQSAMLDEQAKDPFASVAASLLKAGVYSVVAMSYSLWVSGAKEFVPAFYRRLFEGGNVAESVRAGRQRMYHKNERNSPIGKVAFNDWVVPVLYQQSDKQGFLPKLKPYEARKKISPDEALVTNYSFIGRDKDIFRLERAIQWRSEAGILIHGMSGEGKTTLVKGFLQWLESTNGLGEGSFWFTFEGKHSVGNVINVLADRLLGTWALRLSKEEVFSAVINNLKSRRYFLVWDNFETVSGIQRTEVLPLLSDEDREMLKLFLCELYDGKTKVLITSRSSEEWLPKRDCFPLYLGGLEGEELWQYCDAVVSDLGLPLDRKNEDYRTLLNKLGGNPLAIRAIFPRLREYPATVLLAELEESFNGLEGDEAMNRIQAALTVFERGLNRAFIPILSLLGLHEHYAYSVLLAEMLKQTKSDGITHLDACFAVLESAGLCHTVMSGVYKLHPALRSCLTKLYPAGEDTQAFVNNMSGVIEFFTPKELHNQRLAFTVFGASFYRALGFAQQLNIQNAVLVLTQGLAVYALNTRNYAEADRLYREMAEASRDYGDIAGEYNAYHQLGRVAEEQRDFAAAEDWCQKSLAFTLKHGDTYGAATTYHQLGNIAFSQRYLDTAEDYYLKSLAISDENGTARTYHQLGRVAEEQRNFAVAEERYNKSLDIKLKHEDEYNAAVTYHQLGMSAQKQMDFRTAEGYYQKARIIKIKYNDEYSLSNTCYQLGTVAEERGDLATAEDWFKQSLAIWLKYGDEYSAANCYYHLGIIAEELRDFNIAEDWYNKSLEIKLRYNDEYNAANMYYGLGSVVLEQQNFTAAEDWYNKSLEIWLKYSDEYNTALAYYKLGIVAVKQEDFETAEDRYNKALAIFQKYGDGHSVAGVYFGLGTVMEKRGNLNDAEDRYNRSLKIFMDYGDESSIVRIYYSLGSIALRRKDLDIANDWYNKSLELDLKNDNKHSLGLNYHQLGIIAEKRGNLAAAEDYYQKSLAIFERMNDPDRANIARENLIRLQTLRGIVQDAK